MTTWHTNNFLGGMNDVIHPALLKENTAQLLRNAKLDNGKIRSVKVPSFWGRGTPDGDFEQYSVNDRSAVKWFNLHYWSYNGATSAPFYGTDDATWGGPGVPWSPSSGKSGIGVPYCVYDDGETGLKPTFAAAGDADGLQGKYKYCVTLVNWHGWEGAPGSLNSYWYEVALGDPDGATPTDQKQKMTISLDEEDIPANVRYAKVWRTIDKGADFYFVGTLYKKKSGDPNPDGLVDNSWTLVDKTQDSILLFRNPLETVENYAPPSGGKYLCESGGVFFLAVGSQLYFSRQDNPHAWPTTNFIGFNDTITGIAPEFSGVIVFTIGNAWRVTGAESEQTIQRTLIPGNQGCVNYRSIGSISNAPVWLSRDGLCIWDGSNVTVVSDHVVDLDGLRVTAAATKEDQFYLFTRTGVVVFDRKNGGVFRKLSTLADFAWFDPATGSLFFQSGSSIYKIDEGETDMEWTYLSPCIGGTDLVQRVYREIRLTASKPVEVTVFLEDVERARWEVPAGRQRIKLPQNIVGCYISIELVGRGELSELAVEFGN